MKKIMVVEDSNLMVAVISNFIKKEDKEIEVISASNGEEAVIKYSNEKPDLVFMDIKMPGMDGLTALEKIRAANPSAKIVMCTALKEPEQEVRARRAGAKGYITKPFTHEDIVKAMEENL